MEFPTESALELNRPFRKELGQVVDALRRPIRELAKGVGKLKEVKKPAKPVQFLGRFISQNKETLFKVLEIVKRQASKNKDLARQAVRDVLIQEAGIPSRAAEVVSEHLVVATLATNKKEAKKPLKQTLGATTLSKTDKRDLANLVNQTGRELVPAEPEEVEYTPPGGAPGGPPERPRRRFGFGRGRDGRRREDRTAREALGRRRRLPRAAFIGGTVILGLSVITGSGKPWEGYPINWGFDVVGVTGGGVKTGTEMLGRGAIGVGTPEEEKREEAERLAYAMFEDGSFSATDYLRQFIRLRDSNEDFSRPKDMNTIANPKEYNSWMKALINAFDKEVKERKIPPTQVSEELVKKGQPEKPSQYLEWIYQSFITGKPLNQSQLSEIRNWLEKEIGLKWTTR